VITGDGLRARALDALGALGHPLAREALETGALAIDHDVLAWEGSHGPVRAHRVAVRVRSELAAQIAASPSALDELSRAVAAAVSESPGQALADLRIEEGEGRRAGGGPYRGGA
jgi:hypothetical protein